jgi:hypothetical protein
MHRKNRSVNCGNELTRPNPTTTTTETLNLPSACKRVSKDPSFTEQ